MKFSTVCVSALAASWVQAYNPYSEAEDALYSYDRRDLDDDVFDFDVRDVYEAGYLRGLNARDTEVMARDSEDMLQPRVLRRIAQACLDKFSKWMAEKKRVYCPACGNYSKDQKTGECKLCKCSK